MPYAQIKQFVLSKQGSETDPSSLLFTSKAEVLSFADKRGIDMLELVRHIEAEEAKKTKMPTLPDMVSWEKFTVSSHPG